MTVGIIAPNLQKPKTVQDLILKSNEIAHVLGKGEAMSYDQVVDGLESLNDVIEQASIEKTFAPYQTEIIVPLVPGQVQYTIGPSTASPPPDVVAVRPAEVIAAYSRRGGLDVPVFVTHDKADYDLIADKSLQSGWPTGSVYYQAAFPLGSIYVHPQPAESDGSLHLTVLAVLAPFTYLKEEVQVPPGYYQYLKYALAQRICADHGLPFGDENSDILERCRTALKTNNIKPFPVARTGIVGLASSSGGYDIRRDG